MKIILIFFLLVSSLSAQAFFERKVYGMGSTNPEGLVLSAGLAYNYKLWDDSEKNFWNHGFIRPKVSFDTSFLVNTVVGELQVYPIALVGITVGTNYAYRNVRRSNDFDCDIYNCKDELRREYYRVNLNLGAGDIITSLSFQNERLSPRGDDVRPSVELTTLLLIPHEEAIQKRYFAFVGYKLSDDLNFGLVEMFNEMSGPGGTRKSEGQYIAGSLKVDKLQTLLGVGTFGSDYNDKTFSFIVKINWLLDPSLSLND
jgi:hypothetical protein